MSKTILIVDDDPELRTGLSAMLRQRGFQTIEAEDGLEVEALIAGRHPDLVILDMMMPRWGGFMVLEQYQDRTGAPPFIMITANEAEKNREYAERAGVVDFIRKPFSLKRLLQGIEKGLRDPSETLPAPKVERASLRFSCRACGARIKAPLRLMGESRPCPGCGKTFIVRPDSPEDEGPRLVLDLGEEARRPRSS